MELLPEGQQNTATEVKWEDQQQINKFSTLINRKDEQQEELDKLKQEKEYLQDLSLEMELLDEDSKVQYKIGDTFVFIKVSKALLKIEHENEILTKKVDEYESHIDTLDEELSRLKLSLYAKFGKNINLER